MSPEASQPNLHEQMQQDIEAAHQALPAVHEYGGIGTAGEGPTGQIVSTLRADYEGPMVKVTTDAWKNPNHREQVRATSYKEVGDTTMTYDANIKVDANNPDIVDSSKVRVDRWNPKTGESYTHTFKNPDTARKFGSLMARQIVRRAESKPAERRAA